MKKSAEYGGLDYFRIISAFLVVAIHTSPLTSFSNTADFFFTRVLGRIAVPFFFMVTGQFVLSGVMYAGGQSQKQIWHYIRKVLILYGISILLYMPIGIYAGHYKDLTIGTALRMLFFDGTFYHLWYFPACIVGVLLLFFLSRWIHIRGMIAVTGILYLLGLLGDSYYGLTAQIPVLKAVYQSGFHLWSYTRNGLFIAPVFMLMGFCMGRAEKIIQRKYAVVGLAVTFLLMTAEAFALKNAGWQRHDSMYLMLLPVMFFLYQVLLSFHGKAVKYLRKIATWMYILHPFAILLVRRAAKWSALSILAENSLVHYLAVVILSTMAVAVMAMLWERGKREVCATGRAWIELDRRALKNNVQFLNSLLPESCELMPAIKANAYGHGAVLIAKELQKLGIHAFCVACIQEGIELRKAGIRGEILILGYTHPAQFYLLKRYRLAQTVVDSAYADQLRRYRKKLHVHVGIDTGMHRLGERSENMEEICSILQLPNLIVDGIFTHLSADDSLETADREFTEQQVKEFYQVVEKLKLQGIHIPKLHLQSSYGVLNYPELAKDYARVGIALYGVLSTTSDTMLWKHKLQPVLSLKARIASVRTVYAGESVGYSLQFTAKRTMKIAALAIGYADGLPRSLSNGKGMVLIDGRKAAIIGRICMDQTLIDVTDIPGVKSGDMAVLIGRSGRLELTVCDMAEQCGTISNEVLSRLGARIERIWTDTGR